MNKGIVLGIIQVRMGSTRLPKKALKEVAGKPLLWHLAERVKVSSLIDRIAIATADTADNLPIVEFAKAHDIAYFAGDEQDLVSRFYNTAKAFNAKTLVRITGDCPLADPHVIDNIISFYLDNTTKYDYVSNTIKPTYPHGLDADVIPFSTIEDMHYKLKDNFWREWFTSYIIEHPNYYRLANIEHDRDLSYLRWTIDYEEDFLFMKEVFSRLYKRGKIFLMKDILELLDKEPWITDINKKYSCNTAYYEAKKEAGK